MRLSTAVHTLMGSNFTQALFGTHTAYYGLLWILDAEGSELKLQWLVQGICRVTAQVGQVLSKKVAICDAPKANEVCHHRWRRKSVELRWEKDGKMRQDGMRCGAWLWSCD